MFRKLTTTRGRERTKILKILLEANVRWNEELKDAATKDIGWIIDAPGQTNPELKKTIQEARGEKAATAANESVPEEPEQDNEETGQSSSTPRKPQKARKLNKVDG